jgi:hypothetical protein
LSLKLKLHSRVRNSLAAGVTLACAFSLLFAPQVKGQTAPTAGISAKQSSTTSYTLTWTSTNAVSGDLNGTPVPVNGSKVVSPTTTTTYRFTARSASGATDWGQVTVTALEGGSAGTGKTYYVAPTGSDSNDGSLAAPFATIQRASRAVAAGDTVIVRDGSYRGDVVLNASGTPGHPITYIAEDKWKAKLVGTSTGDGSSVIKVGGAHVIIQDFDVTGSDANGIILAYTGTTASFNQAIGNYVHDIITPCDSNSGTAIETGGGSNYSGINHNDMIGNLVVNITPFNGCPGGHQASGLYAQIPYSIIANNIVINAGYGIQSWHAASHVTVYGNTVVNNLRAITIGDGDSPGGMVNDYSLVQNNIIYNSTNTAIAETGLTGTHNRYIDNLIFDGNTNISLNNGLHATGTVYADPRFVNNTGTAAGNYQLQATSPARDSGLALVGITTDFQGTPRPQSGQTDLGALLYVGTSTTPTPAPTGVVAAGVKASATSITGGQSSVISWTTQNAVKATLNGTSVPLNGSKTVFPTVTTTYKVIATNSTGQTDWGSVTVTVH